VPLFKRNIAPVTKRASEMEEDNEKQIFTVFFGN